MRKTAVILAAILISQLLTAANPLLNGESEQVRAFTRNAEFDYIAWTLDAVFVKLQQSALGLERYLSEEDQSQFVRDYIDVVRQIQEREWQLGDLYAEPKQANVADQIEALNSELDELNSRRSEIAPLAESILQTQMQSVLDDLGLTSLGQPLPPILYHSTPLPWALIVSPRDRIEQVANISLQTSLSLEDHIRVEDEVTANLGLSTLVVPVGGVGTYPTMVAQSSSLNWLAEVVSHEWMHNYLTWHPLGLLYTENHELQTMNETTANIVGKEIGASVIARFYPELIPPEPVASTQPQIEAVAPVFDFQKEMHSTRVRVDELLAEGSIDEAEAYMEQQRLIFLEHGFTIRKLNQAYFAFYGSYADQPIGAAGEDPVGAAVRELRARSSSLAEFVHRMSGLTSFKDLQAMLADLN